MLKKIALAIFLTFGTYTVALASTPSPDEHKAIATSSTSESDTSQKAATEQKFKLHSLISPSSKKNYPPQKNGASLNNMLYALVAGTVIALPSIGYFFYAKSKRSDSSESISPTHIQHTPLPSEHSISATSSTVSDHKEDEKASQNLMQDIDEAIYKEDLSKFTSLLMHPEFVQNFNELFVETILFRSWENSDYHIFLTTTLDKMHISIQESPTTAPPSSAQLHLTMGLSEIVQLTHDFSKILKPYLSSLIEEQRKELLTSFFNCFDKKLLFTVQNKHNESFLLKLFCSFNKTKEEKNFKRGSQYTLEDKVQQFNFTAKYILEDCYTYINFKQELDRGLQPHRNSTSSCASFLHYIAYHLTFVPTHLWKHIESSHLTLCDDKGYTPLQYCGFYGKQKLFKALVEAGAPLRFKKGKTILHDIFSECTEIQQNIQKIKTIGYDNGGFFSSSIEKLYLLFEYLVNKDPSLLFERPLPYLVYDEQGEAIEHLLFQYDRMYTLNSTKRSKELIGKKFLELVQKENTEVQKKVCYRITENFVPDELPYEVPEVLLTMIANYFSFVPCLTKKEMKLLELDPFPYYKDYSSHHTFLNHSSSYYFYNEYKIFIMDIYFTPEQFKKLAEHNYTFTDPYPASEYNSPDRFIYCTFDKYTHLYMEGLQVNKEPLGPVRILFPGEKALSVSLLKEDEQQVKGLDEEEELDEEKDLVEVSSHPQPLSEEAKKVRQHLYDELSKSEKTRIIALNVLVKEKKPSKVRIVLDVRS